MSKSADIGSEGTTFEWEKVYAFRHISPEINLVDAKARLVEPVLEEGLVAIIQGHILAGSPTTFSVTAVARYPKNLWAYIRKSLGLNYQTSQVVNTNYRTINRRVCPHGSVARQGAHVRWLSLDNSQGK